MSQIRQCDRFIDRITSDMELNPFRPENIFPMLVRFLPPCNTVNYGLSDAEDVTARSFIYSIRIRIPIFYFCSGALSISADQALPLCLFESHQNTAVIRQKDGPLDQHPVR